MTVSTATLPLRPTKQDINHSRLGADVWMGNQDKRMLASLIRIDLPTEGKLYLARR
jgi:hypothetical protein